MNSSEFKNNSDKNVNIYDIVRRIEALTAELPYEIKQLRILVSEFLKKDKKFTSLKMAADRKANAKSADRVDSFKKAYINSYKRCRMAFETINRETDEVNSLYIKLADHYATLGNRRDEKRIMREASKFENLQRKRLEPIEEAMNSASEIESLNNELSSQTSKKSEFERKKTITSDIFNEEKRREEPPRAQDRRYQQAPNYYQPPLYYQAPVYDPYRMQPPIYPSAPSYNIAPITVDVNRAVDSAMARFQNLFEEKMEEFLDSYDMPELNSKVSADSEENNFSAVLAEKIADNEAFTVEKLASLTEKLNGLLLEIGTLSETYVKLEEKTKLAVESGRSLNEMQRALSRELQGIQATQKVINADQMKTTEEQAVIVEHQKIASAQSSEVFNSQKALAEEFASLINTQNVLREAMQGIITSQNEIINEQQAIIRANLKTQDTQKSLTERQTQLTEMQKDAMAALKKLTRAQKSVNERLGVSVKAKHDDKEELAEVEKEPEMVKESAALLELPKDTVSTDSDNIVKTALSTEEKSDSEAANGSDVYESADAKEELAENTPDKEQNEVSTLAEEMEKEISKEEAEA